MILIDEKGILCCSKSKSTLIVGMLINGLFEKLRIHSLCLYGKSIFVRAQAYLLPHLATSLNTIHYHFHPLNALIMITTSSALLPYYFSQRINPIKTEENSFFASGGLTLKTGIL